MNELCLNGPPESRSAQRRLGIVQYRPALGSEKRLCTSCGKRTWLGPRQLQYLSAHPQTAVSCFTCTSREFRRAGPRSVAFAHFGGRGGSYHHADGRYFGPPKEINN